MPKFAVQMRQISKSYNGISANKKIDFSLKAGTIHAVAGENGAGKSTLMKILFGLEKPDPHSGSEILVHDQAIQFASPLDAIKSGIGMVQQHFALSGSLSALDNILLGAEPLVGGCIIDRTSALKTLKSLAGQDLSVPWEQSVSNLAVGVQQRVEILKLLFRNAEVLILDEPTGVLTPQEVEIFFHLLKKMRNAGKSIVIITHKINEILSLCDEVTVLRHGSLIGTYPTSGLTRDTLIEAMIGRRLKPLVRRVSYIKSPKPLLSAKGLTLIKEGRGSIFDLGFEIKAGEILGIAGVEGNGQQALVETLMGLEKTSGTLHFKEKIFSPHKVNVRNKFNFGLISEDRQSQSLWLDESIENNCVLGMTRHFTLFGKLLGHKMTSHAENILTPYGVKMQSVKQKVSALSGGNQQKVVVAREVSGRRPEVLIVCQPTRGVDVGAIEQIHDSILKAAERGAAILLISSELDEVCKLSDRVLVLTEGKFQAEFLGPEYDFQKIGFAMTQKAKEAV